MQLVETFAMDGWKLEERIIHNEKEYCDYLLEMADKYEDSYMLYTDLEDEL